MKKKHGGKLSNVWCKIFFLSLKQLLCTCASRSMSDKIFSKSKVASVCMREQMSLVMQPTYSESVKLVSNYCRNTRNICARNIWRRNMCRAVFKISGNFSKSQELNIYYGALWNPASHVGNLSRYQEKLSNCVGVGCTAYISMAATPQSQPHAQHR